MASKISSNYVYACLQELSSKINEKNITDFSFENLKKIIEDSKILENKIKVTSKCKVGGWHVFISENRKHDTMKNLGEKWKLMNEIEKEPYNVKALEIREEDKQKKLNTPDEIIFKTKPKTDTNIKKNTENIKSEKPKSVWITFKNFEQENGNTDMGNIKEKYSNLSSEEKNKFEELSVRNFESKNRKDTINKNLNIIDK